MPVRVYSLTDVLKQLNQDSTQYVAPDTSELVSQFVQGEENLIVQPTKWTANDWTPYPFLVADQDGPTSFWLLADPPGSTTAFDSNPYGPPRNGTVNGNVVFGMNAAGAMSSGGEGSLRPVTTSSAFRPGPRTRGAVVGGQVWATPHPFGMPSAAFYGTALTGAFINLPFNAAFNPPTTWSGEAWVYVVGWPGNTNAGIIECRHSSVFTGFLIGGLTPNGSLFTSIGNGTVNTTISSVPGIFKFGQWAHVAVTYDGANANVYYNGNLVAGPTAVGYSPNVDAVTMIGKNLGTGLTLGNGSMVSCAALYPVCLTQTQIQNHVAWGTAPNSNGAFTRNWGVPTKYGWFRYPNPPKRGSNLWGSAIWGSFTWG